MENKCYIVIVLNSRNRVVQSLGLFNDLAAAGEVAERTSRELIEKKAAGVARGYPMVRVFDIQANPEVAVKKYVTDNIGCVGAYCGW